MIKFYNRTIRVNEMANKFYVETKNKAFEPGTDVPVVDDSQVDIFETYEEVEDFMKGQLP